MIQEGAAEELPAWGGHPTAGGDVSQEGAGRRRAVSHYQAAGRRSGLHSLSPSRWINGSSNAESADLGALLRRFEALREADKKIEGDLAGALAQLGKLA